MQHKNFDMVVAAVILVNVLFMSLDYYGMGGMYETVLDMISMGFVAFFTLEMCVKIKALGCKGYISDSWNQFDAVVVVRISHCLTIPCCGTMVSLTVSLSLFHCLTVCMCERCKGLSHHNRERVVCIEALSYRDSA